MNDSSRIRESRVYSFGRFRFFPSGGQLIDGDVPVRLGSRAAEILAALVENAGKVVSHDQLIARAWPDTHVEEGNLRVHISALNKAFRQGRDKRRYITNVPGRGYRFDEMTFPDTEGKSRTESRSIQDEPMSAARIFGRDECITNVAHEIGRNRFVTIVGAGGIGKTTVASAVARKIAESYERVLILDLAPLREQKNVVRKLASLLGIADLKDDLMTAALRAISDRKILIVIDNCEHLIEAAAVLAERLFMECAGTAVLCTSREPLRAIGEYVRRIEPLETPDTSESMSAAEALSYPAVALFVERASEASDWFEFRDTDVAPVVNVCRRLDGLALGIEIAAARAGVLGIQGLSEQLEDMLGLLTSGRRTSLPRHQTISSMLDWSYGLLPPEERMLLTRFSAFVGPVALETVKGVVASKELPAPLIAGLLANLANKSLLMIDTSGPTIRYRLLETTKDYALQKLQEAGESEKLRRRHAEFYLERFIRANRELLETPAQSWIAEYAVCVDNVRLAIDWAFSSKDDEQLGIALTAAASPLLLRLMLYGECRSRVEESLQRFTLTEQSADAREMYLYGALGSSLLLTIGSGPEMLKAWQSAYGIAERVADTDFQLRALCGV
ncbi:MAG: winged helix-turn-helix domain-containing protein, partial [Rhizobiaceae bacterium]